MGYERAEKHTEVRQNRTGKKNIFSLNMEMLK